MSRNDVGALIVEFLGPFALTFLGAGSIIMTGGQNLVAIALTHGLAIGVMIAAGGHFSGAVYNPAIAVGLMAAGKLPYGRGLVYIVVELLGATAAAGILKAALPAQLVDAVHLGTPLPGPGISAGAALVVEIVLTFFLMFVIMGTAIDARGAGQLAPLAIGLTISIDILMGGPISGAAMNPARHFGTMLVQGFSDSAAFASAWVYWIGPIVGALIAALLYARTMLDAPPADTAVASWRTDPEPVPANRRTGRSRRR